MTPGSEPGFPARQPDDTDDAAAVKLWMNRTVALTAQSKSHWKAHLLPGRDTSLHSWMDFGVPWFTEDNMIRGGRKAVKGHTYIARARYGETEHFIVFRVKQVIPGELVTFQFLYRPMAALDTPDNGEKDGSGNQRSED